MKILIVGLGYVGTTLFAAIQSKFKKSYIVGLDKSKILIDNFKKNSYPTYEINLNKYFRLKNSNKLDFITKLKDKKKFDFVFNLAAQAGVRYSIDHPRKYLDANIVGFFNIIENCKKYKINRLFYASSSSVYGENKKFPLKETEKIFPKNIYGLSKKINEEISFIYNNFYNLKLTGLRFFTVYGEWGRPDMMMLKYIDCYYKKKVFKLHNFGNHTRDFTYIKDVVKILFKLIKNNKKLKNNDVLNICSNNPINLSNVISFMKKNNIKPKIAKISLQKADILKTHGDNKKLFKYIGKIKFNNWKSSIKSLIFWYKKNML